MSVENRLSFPSRERIFKAAIATAVVSFPVAGFLVKREVSQFRIKKEQQALIDKSKKELITQPEDSSNSGDSGFIFSKE